jgi:hypothetical protein
MRKVLDREEPMRNMQELIFDIATFVAVIGFAVVLWPILDLISGVLRNG